MLYRLLCILILIEVSNQCVSQSLNENHLTYYTTINGLTDNYITGIAQDEYGYIWVSTSNGLNRFDGKEIKRIYQTHIPGKLALISDKLTGIKALGNKLLAYSHKGLQWMDVTTNSFNKLTVSDKHPASTFQNTVYDAVVINNRICFASTYTGAYAFDSTGKLIFRYDKYLPDSNGNIIGVNAYGRTTVKLDQYKVLHIDKDYNMSVYDSRKNSFLPIDAYQKSLPGLYSLKGTMNIRGRIEKDKLIFLNFHTWELIIHDVVKDSITKSAVPPWFRRYIGWASHWLNINDSTALVYGGHKGLFKISIDPVTLRLSYDSTQFLRKHIFNTAFLDRENRLWLGTENGLLRQSIKQSPLHTIKHPSFNDPKIDYTMFFNCFLRSNDLLYAGSYTTLPILVLDANTFKIKKQLSFFKLSPKCNQVWHIIKYNTDTLWFGTQDGLLWYNERNENFGRVSIPGIDSLIQHRAITLLFKDSQGKIWLQSNWGGGVILYDPVTKNVKRFLVTDKKNFLPLRVVNFVTEDREKNVWFAERGLTRWNRKKGEFDTLITSYYGFNKDNIKITGLSSDENGDVVLCNENNGVLIYNPRTKTYKQISTAQGMQENAAYGTISTDKFLWIITHNYLTAINKKTSRAVSYSYADSLPQALYNTIYHDVAGHRIFIGYDNEMIWTNDTLIDRTNKPISFYIDELKIAKDTTYFFPTGELELTHEQNDVTIHYNALNFDEAESNRYAYRINQKEWISLGSENSIHFSNLSPGKYEVEIKYYAASNINSETIRKITFTILAPFWQRWWFYSILGLAIAGMVYFFYDRRIAEVRHMANLDRVLAQTEIKALHSQMNPHFIFNCLNSIREMILNNENRQASHYLSKFAQLIRTTLENSTKHFVSLKNTIDYLKRYLEMEQIRTDRFSYSIEVDEKLDPEEIFLPPMLIQPFIENAIWHGAGSEKQLQLTIRFFEKDDELICIVEDDGIGIETSLKNKKDINRSSYGIQNIKQRIQLLNEKYNFNGSVIIEDRSLLSLNQTGTRVTLHLPVKNTYT